MTWKELKELAEEAGVTDETEVDIVAYEGEVKEGFATSVVNNIWIVE